MNSLHYETYDFQGYMRAYPCLPALGQITALDWNDRGFDLLYGEGKYDEAKQAYDKATQLDPDDELAWYGRSLALKTLNRANEADLAYKKAKELGL
ncbi:MAG: tetratricopeptide repeat protein [Methanotrichaceae archaeon]|nr:tetratricopeptide repeat protein [Methanotrichaceae archaeon]